MKEDGQAGPAEPRSASVVIATVTAIATTVALTYFGRAALENPDLDVLPILALLGMSVVVGAGAWIATFYLSSAILGGNR